MKPHYVYRQQRDQDPENITLFCEEKSFIKDFCTQVTEKLYTETHYILSRHFVFGFPGLETWKSLQDENLLFGDRGLS